MSCDFIPVVQGSWQRWQSFPAGVQAPGQHGMHHRVQSTNMLFPSNVDPIAQVPRNANGLRVSPSEARAALAAQPCATIIDRERRSSVFSDGSSSTFSFSQQSPNRSMGNFRVAQTNARGLHAGFEILPMFGDKPPQSSRSSPRLGSNGASVSSYNLGFGFGSDMQSHYSFRPDVGRAMCSSDVDESMAEWEQELFQSYRKIKYYGEEELSKEQTVEIVTKFTAAAREAWVKLETAARSDQVTQGFKMFFKSIRSFEHLTRLGFQNLDQVLEGKTPTSLIPIYSVLHVAYAISQTTSSSIPQLSQPLAVSTFCADAQKRWKKCLKSGPNSLGFSEEGVFDELLAVMTQEIDAALEWISTRTCMTAWTNVEEDDDSESQSYILNHARVMGGDGSTYQHSTSNPSNTFQASSKCHPMGLPPERQPGRAQWDVVMGGPMFAHILSFLENLPKLGSVMSRLSYPVAQIQQLSTPTTQTRPQCQTLGDFKTSILKFIISQIWGKQKFNWVGHIMRAAINMVQYGAIQCLRDFEDYVVGLTKFCEEVPKRLDFLDAFLDICVTFAPMFTDLQVRKGQAPYCTGYRNARLRLERAAMLFQYQARRHSMQIKPTGSPSRSTRANSISHVPLENLRLQLPLMDFSSEGILSNSPPQLSPTGSFSSGTVSEATSMTPSAPAGGSPSLSISTLGDAMGTKTATDSVYDFLVPTNSWNSQQMQYQASGIQEVCQGISVGWSQAYGTCQITAPTTIADIVTNIATSSAWGGTGPASAHTDFAPVTGFAPADIHNISDLMGHVSEDTPESMDDAADYSDTAPQNNTSEGFQDMETDSDPIIMSSIAKTATHGIRPRRAPRSKKAPGGRIFICDFPGCGAEIRGAKYTQSNSNLLRHQRSSHGLGGSVGTEFTCEVAGCVAKYRGARARENLKTHMKNKHGIRTKALRKGGRQPGSNMPLEIISEDESS